MWCDFVVETVSAQECNRHILAGGRALVIEEDNRRRRFTPRGQNVKSTDLREAWKLFQSGATNDRNADV